MVKVSVIVAAYNVAQEIERCLQSLHTQMMQDAEFLIIDDGSTDKTAFVIKNYLNKVNDSRFKYLYKNNGGHSDARNYGLLRAQGEYIWFVDGDDTVKPIISLDTLYNYAHDESLEILEFNYMRITPKKIQQTFSNREDKIDISGLELLSDGITLNYSYATYVWHYLYQQQFLNDINATFKNGIYMEDELFTIPLLLKAQKTGYLNQNFYNYYYRENSITSNKSKKHRIHLAKDHLYVVNTINNCLNQMTIPDEYLYKINQLLARTYLINSLKMVGYNQKINLKNVKDFINNKHLNKNIELMKIILLDLPKKLREILCKLIIKMFP